MCRRHLLMNGTRIVALLWFFVLPGVISAQYCDFPDGGTLTGVVNTYYSAGSNSPRAGDTTITVDPDSVRPTVGYTPIAAGDMLLVIQMQDANFRRANNSTYGANDGTGYGYTNPHSTGYFEYVIAQSGATLCGIGCVIEKVFEGGRDHLSELDVPVLSLAKIDLDGDSFTVF